MNNEILTSASKMVFLLMALAVIGGMFLGKIESKDFMLLASMTFTFYFAYKGSSTPTTTTTENTAVTEVPPNAGK